MRWGRTTTKTDEPTPEVLLKRLPAMQTDAVRDWAGHYLNIVGDMLLQHARQGDPAAIQEAEDAGIALLAAVREIKRRS